LLDEEEEEEGTTTGVALDGGALEGEALPVLGSVVGVSYAC
jgi:hypothetical protein